MKRLEKLNSPERSKYRPVNNITIFEKSDPLVDNKGHILIPPLTHDDIIQIWQNQLSNPVSKPVSDTCLQQTQPEIASFEVNKIVDEIMPDLQNLDADPMADLEQTKSSTYLDANENFEDISCSAFEDKVVGGVRSNIYASNEDLVDLPRSEIGDATNHAYDMKKYFTSQSKTDKEPIPEPIKINLKNLKLHEPDEDVDMEHSSLITPHNENFKGFIHKPNGTTLKINPPIRPPELTGENILDVEMEESFKTTKQPPNFNEKSTTDAEIDPNSQIGDQDSMDSETESELSLNSSGISSIDLRHHDQSSGLSGNQGRHQDSRESPNSREPAGVIQHISYTPDYSSSRTICAPTMQSDANHVRLWLYKNHFEKRVIDCLNNYTGHDILALSKPDMCDVLQNRSLGIRLYNKLHVQTQPKAQKTFFICFRFPKGLKRSDKTNLKSIFVNESNCLNFEMLLQPGQPQLSEFQDPLFEDNFHPICLSSSSLVEELGIVILHVLKTECNNRSMIINSIENVSDILLMKNVTQNNKIPVRLNNPFIATLADNQFFYVDICTNVSKTQSLARNDTADFTGLPTNENNKKSLEPCQTLNTYKVKNISCVLFHHNQN